MSVEERVAGEARGIVAKAIEILSSVPLCDRCLGRMFGLLGRGLSNAERGRALKIVVLASLHTRVREGDEEAIKLFERIAPNMGEVAAKLYAELTGRQLEAKRCYICGSALDEVIRKAAEDAIRKLHGVDARTFVVAAYVPDDVLRRERELVIIHRLPFAESIKAELRREVSKLVQRHGYRPDFTAPDVVINVYFDTASAAIDVRPLLLRTVYKKLARRISQSTWVSGGELKYPYSVELAYAALAKATGGERVVLHAAGREDVDVRMLGSGRPGVVEVKKPVRRYVDHYELERLVNEAARGLVEVRILGRASRQDVRRVKEEAEKHRKTYKALVVTAREVSDEALAGLERFFFNRRVTQRTPKRVRHRRADVVREKTVYRVITRRLAPNAFEALIDAEAGLYIKELVDGDGGDTTPSFAEVLGTDAYCAELDVVYITTG